MPGDDYMHINLNDGTNPLLNDYYYMQRNKLDIDFIMFIALASAPNAHSLIHAKYKENEWEYYQAYKESPYSKEPLLKIYLIETEAVLRKLIGIYAYCKNDSRNISEERKMEPLITIIKKGYSRAYRFVNERSEFNLLDYTDYIMKKSGGNNPYTVDFIYSVAICIYLASVWKKRALIPEEFLSTYDEMLNSPHSYQSKKFFLAKNKAGVKECMEQFGTTKIDANQSLFHWLAVNYLKRISEKEGKFLPEKEEEMNSYFMLLGNWIETLDLDPVEIQNKVFLSREEMELTFQELLIADIENENVSNKFELLLPAYLYMMAMAKMYKDLKKLYLEDKQEETYLANKIKEKKLKEKEESLKKLKKTTELKLKEAKEQRLALEKQVKELEKQNARLESEVETLSKEKKELSSLRSFIYGMNSDIPQDTIKLDDVIHSLKKVKIAVFGGHPNWQLKIRESLPHVRVIDVDSLNKSISFIKNMDYVFVNTHYFNHTFYEKIMKEVNRTNAELVYLNRTTNTEMTLMEMHSYIK
ncbi:hypothetical protein CN357_04375 [Bacillus cereus]|uniref:DUF2325 domain-containing protein n=2 Tax=Bacillus TaxID=1386 RepID=A0A9X6ZHA3_BACCE|nr:hypothetical protein CN357_04375 [Bacillus cereus]PFQ37787.1 hypothetical protein COK33_14585 [Bacillus cereus]PGB13187.1 hypothetical protein COM09_15650 [Bacillus toyonensis]